jgi:hypothetical protein
MSPIYALLLNRLINDYIILIDINGNNEDNSGEKWGSMRVGEYTIPSILPNPFNILSN